MSSKTWRTPDRREVGLFTDLSLFSEALELAFEQGIITKYYLMEELSQRVRGLLFVESQSSRGAERLISESYKKGNLSISYVELHRKFAALYEGPIKEGIVSIIDLDQNNLLAALFERDSGVVIDLWQQAANRDISPKRSIRYLTLRITNESIWWSENVYQEMEDYHAAQDE